MNLNLLAGMAGISPDEIKKVQDYAARLATTIERLEKMADFIEKQFENGSVTVAQNDGGEVK